MSVIFWIELDCILIILQIFAVSFFSSKIKVGEENNMYFTNFSVDPEEYPGFPQTSMMENFAIIVNGNLTNFECEYFSP